MFIKNHAKLWYRSISIGSACLLLLTIGFLIYTAKTAPTAHAANETLTVRIAQTDGTPAFTDSDGPGLDSSATNGIVRTNDNITYDIEVRVDNDAATNTTFTIELPKGTEMQAVPAYCTGSGSSLTPASLPAPTLPSTATSWESLPTQTLVCNVGDRQANSTLSYPVVARVRGEVPNQATLGPVQPSATTDAVTTPVLSENTVSATVSARAQFELSKNGIAANPNSGYVPGPSSRACSFDSDRRCMSIWMQILMYAPAGGKGATPLDGPITFTDDLSPESYFPAGYEDNPNWIAAGSDALDRYGARYVTCGAGHVDWSAPRAKIQGSNATAENSVRDSGTMNCAQPGGAGAPVSIEITGMDSTLHTSPTQAGRPDNVTLPADKAYVFAGAINYELPYDTIRELGDSSGTDSWTFPTRNVLKDLEATGVDGIGNRPENLDDNWRSYTYVASNTGSFSKAFMGVPGYPNNIPPATWSVGNVIWEGLPDSGTRRSGNAPAAPTQPVISNNYLHFANRLNPSVPTSVISCDSWDNSKLWLKKDNYPGSSSASGQRYVSNGEAVWVSGYSGVGARPALIVEYGSGAASAGDGSKCDDDTSPVGWKTDPNDPDFNNDPTKAAQGVYTGVTRVRVYAQIPFSEGSVTLNISIGQVVADDPGPVGERIPNWAAVKIAYADTDFNTLKSSAHPWSNNNDGSTYNPETHVGGSGDRLTVVRGSVRIKKEVRGPSATDFGTTIPSVTGGQSVTYRLSPSFSSGINSGTRNSITVEDCLPAGQQYRVGSASRTPNIVQFGAPTGSDISCGSTNTYLRWVFDNQVVNSAIEPITFIADIGRTSNPGTYTNHVRVSSPEDVASTPAMRSSLAQIQVVQPSGIEIEKISLTPQQQINRPGNQAIDQLRWRINFVNINRANGGVVDVDIIDVLPQNDVSGSSYHGTLAFDSVTTTGGTSSQPIRVLYSRDATVNSNPQHASNMSGTATTTWCTLPAGGTPEIGSGACPASADEVTALRILRPGGFTSGEVISADITLTPRDNRAGDIYVNQAAGAMTGLLPVGPSNSPATVVSSSIGDTVWIDTDRDGVLDDDEIGIRDVTVTLTGTDDLGNPVELATTTDAQGRYAFDNLRAGTYEVTVDPTTLPQFSTNTYSLGGGTTAPVNTSGSITLAQNTVMPDADFGYAFVSTTLNMKKTAALDDANDDSHANAGENITYTFAVTNTGQAPLENLAIDDPRLASANVTVTCEATALEPGQSTNCTATYAVTEEDAAVCSLANTAIARAGTEDGDIVSLASTATIDTEACRPADTSILEKLADTGMSTMIAIMAGIGLLSGGVLLHIRRLRRG